MSAKHPFKFYAKLETLEKGKELAKKQGLPFGQYLEALLEKEIKNQSIPRKVEGRETIMSAHGFSEAEEIGGDRERPELRCLCGYRTPDRGSWESVGYEFDCHLAHGDNCHEAEKQREKFPERFGQRAVSLVAIVEVGKLPGIDSTDARKRSYGEPQAFAAGAIVQRAPPCGSIYPSRVFKERGIERACTLNREHSEPHCHNGLTWAKEEKS